MIFNISSTTLFSCITSMQLQYIIADQWLMCQVATYNCTQISKYTCSTLSTLFDNSHLLITYLKTLPVYYRCFHCLKYTPPIITILIFYIVGAVLQLTATYKHRKSTQEISTGLDNIQNVTVTELQLSTSQQAGSIAIVHTVGVL